MMSPLFFMRIPFYRPDKKLQVGQRKTESDK